MGFETSFPGPCASCCVPCFGRSPGPSVCTAGSAQPLLCLSQPGLPRGGRPDARLPGRRCVSRQPPPGPASSPTATCGLRPLLFRPVCVGHSSLTPAWPAPCPPLILAPASPRGRLPCPPCCPGALAACPAFSAAPSSGVPVCGVCPTSCLHQTVSFWL